MSRILFEDRTTETAEEAQSRQAFGAALFLANTAFGICDGDAETAARALAAALGVVAARTEIPVDEMLEVVRKHCADTLALASQATKRSSDA